MQVAHIAKALGGEVAGRAKVLGPCQSAADRSLSVMLDPAAPQGFRVHSFAGDAWQACCDHVRQQLGLGEWTQQEDLSPAKAIFAVQSAAVCGRLDNDYNADTLRRQVPAGEIWRAAMPINGTLAEAYLASRGLTYHGNALRWHPACPFGKLRLGCMVALVRNVITNEPQAIHRTAISATAEKIGRLSLGPISGGAIKLGTSWPLSQMICERNTKPDAARPSRAPELNPVENIWQFLRQNFLSDRVFETYDAIIDAACEAWSKLLAKPSTITSIGMRQWAHIGQS